MEIKILRYIKKIKCPYCEEEFEVEIKDRGVSKHGHWVRKCPHCHKRWRVSNQKGFLPNNL